MFRFTFQLYDGKVAQALLVCKWGGEITHAGIAQAARYAPIFWDENLRPVPPVTPPPGRVRWHALQYSRLGSIYARFNVRVFVGFVCVCV